MLLSLEGDEKTGKTTFAYSGPLPIVGYNFDIGENRAINGTMHDKLFKGLKIEIVPYPKNPADRLNFTNRWQGNDITIFRLPPPIQIDNGNPTGYIDLWNWFIGHLGLAISDDSVGSYVLDTATIARRVKSDARLEELNLGRQPNERRKQLLQIEYGPINDAIRNIYSMAANLDKNFISVHHMTDEYKPQIVQGETVSVPTGKKVLEGLNGTHRFVDVAIQQSIDGKNEIHSKILVCGFDTGLQGLELPKGTNNWNGLVDLIEGSLSGRIQFPRRTNMA